MSQLSRPAFILLYVGFLLSSFTLQYLRLILEHFLSHYFQLIIPLIKLLYTNKIKTFDSM
jgi:hypothetical protein